MSDQPVSPGRAPIRPRRTPSGTEMSRIVGPLRLDGGDHRSDDEESAISSAAAAPRFAPMRVEVTGLSKSFGSARAVDNLSFTVEPGSVTGFLGPNGAGKTTTLRMVLG